MGKTKKVQQPILSKSGSSSQQQVNSGKQGSRTGVNFISEEDDLVDAPPHLVHLSAGKIPRRDLEVLQADFEASSSEIPLNSNGIVPISEQGKNPNSSDENQAKWSSLFAGSRLTKKGMKLGFVKPLIKNGAQVVQLHKDEIEKMSIKWESAMILYVVGFDPTIAALNRFIAKEWNNVQTPHVYLHDDGYFVIHFKSVGDRDEILFSRPHTFLGKPAITKAWTANFNFQDEILKIVPIWVKLPSLPLSCWSGDSLSRIGSSLGVPIYADECTTQQLRVSFARLLVEIDVTLPMPNSIQIEGPDGQVVKQQVIYEWKPAFCKVCKQVGHDCSTKQKKTVKTKAVWKPKPQSQPVTSTDADGQPTKELPEQDVVTPEPTKSSGDADTGWKVITKKLEILRKPVNLSANSYNLLATLEDDPGGSDTGGETVQDEG